MDDRINDEETPQQDAQNRRRLQKTGRLVCHEARPNTEQVQDQQRGLQS